MYYVYIYVYISVLAALLDKRQNAAADVEFSGFLASLTLVAPSLGTLNLQVDTRANSSGFLLAQVSYPDSCT